jgi:hypothetical protein
VVFPFVRDCVILFHTSLVLHEDPTVYCSFISSRTLGFSSSVLRNGWSHRVAVRFPENRMSLCSTCLDNFIFKFKSRKAFLF